MRRLCVGGVGDGEWHDDHGDQRLTVAQRPVLPWSPYQVPVVPADVPELLHSHYRRVRLVLADRETDILLDMELQPAEALRLLLEGYRVPKPASRPLAGSARSA